MPEITADAIASAAKTKPVPLSLTYLIKRAIPLRSRGEKRRDTKRTTHISFIHDPCSKIAERHIDINVSSEFAAFAGEVEGSVTASLPVMDNRYFL